MDILYPSGCGSPIITVQRGDGHINSGDTQPLPQSLSGQGRYCGSTVGQTLTSL